MNSYALWSMAFAVLIAGLWVIGWVWRIRSGLLEGASRRQVAATVVLVASVPTFALILGTSLIRSS